MKFSNAKFTLSASDLANHLSCKHLTELNRSLAKGEIAPPSWRDPDRDRLRELGMAHENAFVEHLRNKGLQISELRDEKGENASERTIAAMREGKDVIVQATLQGEGWHGRADILYRVDEPSELGNWSYEVIDTKLGQNTKGGTVLQLCLYTELVGKIQGRMPVQMHVVKPGDGFEWECFRFDDFKAYYQLVRGQLLETVAAASSQATYPNPVPHCDVCRWWKECDTKRHDDDHLSLVAGMPALHRSELERQDTKTLAQFAGAETSLVEKPKHGTPETYRKLQAQAKIQLAGRVKEELISNFLPLAPGYGFFRLPKPSAGDIFFDIESDAFIEGGGLEYLFGYAFTDDSGGPLFRGLWALNHQEEKQMFEQFIDFVTERWQKYPNMFIYHFAPYEPAALKRLMGRHNTRQIELDELLRGGRFVDLHAVAKQGLLASVESYGLKELEKFCEFRREVELRTASSARRRLEYTLELGAASELTDRDRELVEAYNRDDCFATLALRDWLEEKRQELLDQGHTVPRPEPKDEQASENVQEHQQEIQQVYERLLAGLPEDEPARNPEEQAKWLLAQLLTYFDREGKCAWWEFFRRHGLDHEALLEERKAVAGLEFIRKIPPEGRSRVPVHCYGFPFQEAAFHEGDELHEVGGEKIGKVESIDHARSILNIKKQLKTVDIHPPAVFVNEVVRPKPLDSSLLALGHSVADEGVYERCSFRAARDLLLKNRPRVSETENQPLQRTDEDILDAAIRLARSLDHSVLAIQGPPGTGKTYTAARMILELVRLGKRIGVTAVGHKVIRNLLEETLRAAAEKGLKIEAVHKGREKEESLRNGLQIELNNDTALAALEEGKVVGGTAWLWSREDAVETVDYLFVDEAGQMSLAHVLAAARSAHNLILLGDPQQLEQPQKGAHPAGTDVDALTHLLDGADTMPPDKGLFIETTRRLHPDLAKFTSELYYEKRLKTLAGLERQAISGDTRFAGSGLFYTPVVHEGNQNNSPEEVETVARIVADLLKPAIEWTNENGRSKTLGTKDILIVAPYNAQVGALQNRLPEIRVGTVDKFQGQEAPVVIYSMASSSAEDAPRGMGFLYSPNRLNVATSRARCICILVAAARLLEPDCRTPEQMRWANGLCRFRELATVVNI
ncbi:TM0106 family RecB-like putative nuclease [candidate division KSB1 bacterium]|nr:TM0106 family RecB-like putative nuclease [candidate division KSB1 bacterium]